MTEHKLDCPLHELNFRYGGGPQHCTCGADKPTPPYGLCPVCGSPGLSRERRPDGYDSCENGHVYPSRTANMGASPMPTPPAPTAEVESCATCEHEHKLCGPPPCNYTPKAAPTDAEVREAVERQKCKIAEATSTKKNIPYPEMFSDAHTILAALDKAQGEVERHEQIAKVALFERDALRAELASWHDALMCVEDGQTITGGGAGGKPSVWTMMPESMASDMGDKIERADARVKELEGWEKAIRLSQKHFGKPCPGEVGLCPEHKPEPGCILTRDIANCWLQSALRGEEDSK